jgi:hypothetical protein
VRDHPIEISPDAVDGVDVSCNALWQLLRTDVSVLSIGSGGWGQDQELLALQAHIKAAVPSAVVLWFTEGNDLWNNTFPTHFPKDGTPKPPHDAVISKTDGHWNTEGNNYVMESLGRQLASELR